MKTESGDELVSRPSAADDVFRNLLRGAMKDDAGHSPDVLTGFQRKVRERSGGKFYADGWSTAKHDPTNTYLITVSGKLKNHGEGNLLFALPVTLRFMSGS